MEKKINNQIQYKFGIIGNSPLIRESVRLILQAAPTDLTILITGETGTGKEIFANAIHGLSNRKKYPFVGVNCGAIPETLLESELFGHERGAFTSANEQRKGFFEVSNRGTIFLDEIGEMPYQTQVKLLRILETGEFSRLGSSEVRKVDVRVITATNRDLEQEVRDGKFRQDLFFRLNSVHIKLPPLREHPEDIPELVTYFAEKTAEKNSFIYNGISNDALNLLRHQPWPGNVRQLRNLIETIITLEKTDFITSDMLRSYIPAALPPHNPLVQTDDVSLISLRPTVDTSDYELGIIFKTLLEMRQELGEVKRYLFSLNSKIDGLRAEAAEFQEHIEIPVVKKIEDDLSEKNLNIFESEKILIKESLRRTRGNRRQAAKQLGISERTLYRKLTEYDLI